MIIPFFQVLFGQEAKKFDTAPTIYDGADWLEYTFSSMIGQYGREDALLYICLAIVSIFFLKNLFRYLSLYFLNPARNGIVKELRKGMYRHLIQLPIHKLKTHQRGDIITRLTSDAQEVEWSIMQVLEAFIKAPLTILGSLLFMVFISPKLTVFVFVLMIFTVIIIGGISKTLRKESKGLQENLAALSTTVDETISGSENIRSYNTQDKWVQRFDTENESFFYRIVKLLRRKDLASPVSEFLGIFVVAILLYYGAFQVFREHLSAETFFAFIFAFYQIIEPSKSFSSAYYNYQKGLAAYERIEAFSTSNLEDIKEDIGRSFSTLKDSIEFEDLTFQYPEDDTQALKGINFKINKGEHVALVGASGSGKTSILNLLLKFYHASTGKIKVDGIDIKDLNTRDWREQIALVTQEPFLYHASIFENIGFGRENVTEEMVRSALKEVKLEAYAANIDQSVGERGQLFSGGEKQRMAIARALAGNPSLLLLDEPTSALDAEAEKEVSLAIKRAMEGRTSIIIAHRFSTIKHADKIIVLDKGKVVETGDHESLIALEGYYKKYLSLQSDF